MTGVGTLLLPPHMDGVWLDILQNVVWQSDHTVVPTALSLVSKDFRRQVESCLKDQSKVFDWVDGLCSFFAKEDKIEKSTEDYLHLEIRDRWKKVDDTTLNSTYLFFSSFVQCQIPKWKRRGYFWYRRYYHGYDKDWERVKEIRKGLQFTYFTNSPEHVRKIYVT
jgi:hypothetical protein